MSFNPAEPVDYITFSHVGADGMEILKATLYQPANILGFNIWPMPLLPWTRLSILRDQNFFGLILCIPIGEAFVEYRKLATQRMRFTYQRAKKVLVLGKGVLSSSKGARPGERIVRIVLSTWMRRLWTFQEVFLAQYLPFQFAMDRAC
ncbi:hypothetical protein BGZ60DRAFT_531277 [Tricladium varicosporioides]|nr:hypothetical protein BGZ60DRAFT_531277 [Hymenoscyphus varicosporioides]